MAYKEIVTKRGEQILVDEKDYGLVADYSWNTNATGYAYAYVKGSGRDNHKTITMHRLIMGFPDKLKVDHVNRNKLDNRQANLRICTSSQNMGNAIGYSKKTKYKGLDLLPTGRWRARINIGGKSLHLGVAVTEKEAAALYNTAAAKHYGTFALLNNLEG